MELETQLAGFALQQVTTPLGVVAWREAMRAEASASAPVLVLLHGIGSASGTWVLQLAAAQRGELPLRVLAWDAPGYGGSAALPMAEPTAGDYAQRIWAWLDALKVDRVALAGHSLGALMAAAACRQKPTRVRALTLLSPAQGYARADAALRASKLQDRLAALATLGPEGMARKRGAAMVSAAATQQQVAYVQGLMAQIDPAGYTQAAHMLAHGDLLGDVQGLPCPAQVASGSADTITPEAGCQAVANAAGAPYASLGPVGHACAVEAGAAVTHLLARQTSQQNPDPRRPIP